MNKKAVVFLLMLLACFQLLPAQNVAPVIQWQKSFGGSDLDAPLCIKSTSDGGYIMIGGTLSHDGDVVGVHGNDYDDCWVVKISGTGELQWQKCLGGTGEEAGNSIQQTTDGGYILAGGTEYSNNGDILGNHGDTDAWIAKLDSTGNIVWSECLGGSYGDDILTIEQTTDGGYILAGATISPFADYHGGGDAWIIKLNSNGTVMWSKCFGGTSEELANYIEETADKGFIFSGRTYSNDGDVSGYHGGADYWVVKIDSAGNLQWQKCLGGTGDEESYSVHQAKDSGYIVSGYTYLSSDGDVTGNHGQSDFWVVKLTKRGDLVWQNSLGGSGFETRCVSTIDKNNGNCIIAGSTTSIDGQVSGNKGVTNAWIVNLDSSGNLLWEQCYGGSQYEEAGFIIPSSDGGYVLLAASTSNDGDVTGNHGASDFWVVKLSAGSVLPLNLISFGAITGNDAINMHWETAQENNVSRFIIQRSFNGDSFDSIGSVTARGNTQTLTNYNFPDFNNYMQENIYYRLKILDKDGSFNYSQVINVKSKATKSVLINPNPAHGILHAKIQTDKQEKIIVIITDINGSLLHQHQQEIYKGDNLININVSNFSKGVYMLLIKGKTSTYYKWEKN